jgi:hypothetical protein
MTRELTKYSLPAGKWTKRVGIVTFLFFLGKGLVWLAIITAGACYALD